MYQKIFKRVKESTQVLLGQKKLQPEKKFEGFKNEITINSDLENYIQNLNIEFIFTEFGKRRVNAGGAILSQENRLEPSLSGIKKYFPNSKVTVFTDFDLDIKGVNSVIVDSPIPEPEHPRFLYRTSVYHRFKGLIESEADFVCAIDSDMYFVNENVLSLVTLTEKFGFCVPYTPRQIMNQDMKFSLDAEPINDESMGCGHSYNQSPMTLWKGDARGMDYYKKCMEIMRENPSRGSLVMWKAAWETGIYPYILPKQWCVCNGDEGCGEEILLHIGHPKVADYYKI